MLLSPGNSPRQLSSPSPSLSLSSADHHNHNQHPPSSSSIQQQKPPKKSASVLDEDSYVAAIEKIIERDFFPDIPKLRDRLDWLQAVRTRDPVQIRDAQLKILERRRGSNNDTQGKFVATPGSTFFRNSATPFEFDRTPSVIDGNPNSNSNSNLNSNSGCGVVRGDNDDDDSRVDVDVDVSLSLDQFFRRYTSEDNDSFNKIMEKVNRKRKERFAHLLEGEMEDDGDRRIEDVKRDRITDGYGTSDQPTSTLESWKYCAKNLLMYHPADRGEVSLTEEEVAQRMKGLTKEVDRYNTRFHGKMLDSGPKEEDEVEVLYPTVAGGTPVMLDRNRDKTKKYDLEDLTKSPNMFYVESEKKADNGYRFVKTPSPAPGVGESPIITWGEIEGTPLRLEAEDTPLDIGGSGDGPHFKIPVVPTRDLKAHSLSREAARKLKERSRMYQKPPILSPMRSGSASPSVRTLSPAAQKFVRKAMAKTSTSVDESLRASYRGNSPALGTPKSGRSESRLARDGTLGSKSPSVRDASNPPW